MRQERKRLIGVLRVRHVEEFLCDFSSSHKAYLIMQRLSLVDDDSHIIIHVLPSKHDIIGSFIEGSQSYADIKHIEAISLPGIHRAVYIIKRSYGVQRALSEVRGFLLGSPLVYRGYKLFPIAIPRNMEITLIEKVRRYAPKGALVKLTRKLPLHTIYPDYNIRLHVLPRLSEHEALVLRLAHEKGFFEWPRKISLEKLANEVGLSKATVAQHLRTAIKKILSTYLTLTHSGDQL